MVDREQAEVARAGAIDLLALVDDDPDAGPEERAFLEGSLDTLDLILGAPEKTASEVDSQPS